MDSHSVAHWRNRGWARLPRITVEPYPQYSVFHLTGPLTSMTPSSKIKTFLELRLSGQNWELDTDNRSLPWWLRGDVGCGETERAWVGTWCPVSGGVERCSVGGAGKYQVRGGKKCASPEEAWVELGVGVVGEESSRLCRCAYPNLRDRRLPPATPQTPSSRASSSTT